LRSFSRYVPQEVVLDLLKTREEATLGLEEAELSVFFLFLSFFFFS